MHSSDLELIRFDELTSATQKIFGKITPEMVDQRIETSGSESITEMLEVTEIDRRGIRLNYAFEDISVFPVRFPRAITPLLQTGDMFLMTILKNGSTWRPIYMGPPYENHDWDYIEDDEKEPKEPSEKIIKTTNTN